jgi:hypothetical protein
MVPSRLFLRQSHGAPPVATPRQGDHSHCVIMILHVDGRKPEEVKAFNAGGWRVQVMISKKNLPSGYLT